MAHYSCYYTSGKLCMCAQDKISLLFILGIGHHAVSHIHCTAILPTEASLSKF